MEDAGNLKKFSLHYKYNNPDFKKRNFINILHKNLGDVSFRKISRCNFKILMQ